MKNAFFTLIMLLNLLFVSTAFAVDSDGDGLPDDLPAASCNESRFTATVCWQDVPKTIKYSPSYPACGGKAAALLSGDFLNSYSIVLRDRENRDRFPACKRSGTNYNSCSFNQCDGLGLNRCSAFKCQKTFFQGKGKKREKVCCFGEKGTSSTLRGATRMTIKVKDVPGSNKDPLVRVALKKNDPTLSLNDPK